MYPQMVILWVVSHASTWQNNDKIVVCSNPPIMTAAPLLGSPWSVLWNLTMRDQINCPTQSVASTRMSRRNISFSLKQNFRSNHLGTPPCRERPGCQWLQIGGNWLSPICPFLALVVSVCVCEVLPHGTSLYWALLWVPGTGRNYTPSRYVISWPVK